MPVARSWETTLLTVLDGIAKPMPTLPAWPPAVVEPVDSICELTPITWPAALNSGPPELPGLIAASVWMTSSIEKPLGEEISRCSALTTPVVSVRSRPNGLPIAYAGSPTSTLLESASVSGLRLRGGDLQEREVGRGVLADELGVERLAVADLGLDLAVRALDDVARW